jgi:hypothetical protein
MSIALGGISLTGIANLMLGFTEVMRGVAAAWFEPGHKINRQLKQRGYAAIFHRAVRGHIISVADADVAKVLAPYRLRAVHLYSPFIQMRQSLYRLA